VDDLLRSISWHAEKRFRRHGTFASVLWLTEDAAGRRQLFETGCHAPESVATDAQVVAALAAEMRADFAKTGVTRFAVAYLARRVTVIRPVDPTAAMQPKTTKRCGVATATRVCACSGKSSARRAASPCLAPPRPSMSRSRRALISTCCVRTQTPRPDSTMAGAAATGVPRCLGMGRGGPGYSQSPGRSQCEGGPQT
jgi:hypothetical protein